MLKLIVFAATACLGVFGISKTDHRLAVAAPDEIPPACAENLTCRLVTPIILTIPCQVGSVTIFDTSVDSPGSGNVKGECECDDFDNCLSKTGEDDRCKVSRTIAINSYSQSVTIKHRVQTVYPDKEPPGFGGWSASGSSITVNMLEQCGIMKTYEIAAFDNSTGAMICGPRVYTFGCDECEGGC